tara:strand:- start:376 stop:978 length:603 start_codon:yes stop_codon:yes gene_type:complete
MSRDIPAALLTALSQPEIQPFYAVELMFDPRTVTDVNGDPFAVGPLRLWTGTSDRVIEVQGADQTFTATGGLLSIGGLDEVSDLSAKSIQLTLSGINTSILSIALQEPYQRRICRLYFGEQSVDDVVQIFAGKMNTMSIQDESTSSSITLDVESNLIELERSSGWRYTNENHQSRYSGDTFFSYVQTIQDQQVAWGRKSA